MTDTHSIRVSVRVSADAHEADSQVAACGCLSVLLERCGPLAKPLAPAVLHAAPHIWRAGAGQPLLQMQVLSVLSRVVAVLGADSPAAAPVVVPVLGEAADAAGADAGTLMEDALILWQARGVSGPPFRCVVDAAGAV